MWKKWLQDKAKAVFRWVCKKPLVSTIGIAAITVIGAALAVYVPPVGALLLAVGANAQRVLAGGIAVGVAVGAGAVGYRVGGVDERERNNAVKEDLAKEAQEVEKESAEEASLVGENLQNNEAYRAENQRLQHALQNEQQKNEKLTQQRSEERLSAEKEIVELEEKNRKYKEENRKYKEENKALLEGRNNMLFSSSSQIPHQGGSESSQGLERGPTVRRRTGMENRI